MPLAPTKRAPQKTSIRCPTGRTIDIGHRPLVMGVINLTPDSFSDGGRWADPDSATARAEQMYDEGADILDLGAESTRPGGGVYGAGARSISAEEELNRLLPVLARVRSRVPIPISVDTRKGLVAKEAIAAGADLINDMSSLSDPEMAVVAAESSAPIVIMHSRGQLGSMQKDIQFDNLIEEICSELTRSIRQAENAGISREKILVDPGIGFGKTRQQNLEILRNLDQISKLGTPVLVGASRKSFIGEITGTPASDRLAGSLAAIGWAARSNTAIVRVHDVEPTVQFLKVWDAVATARKADR